MLINTTIPRQLTKATLPTANVVGQPWATGLNTGMQAAGGILVQSDYSNAAGSYIEIGGPDVAAGNGIQLAPGDTDYVNAATASLIWAIPSANNLLLRGQVR